MNLTRKSVGIIGFGRFGETLAKILMDDFHIKIFDIIKPKTFLPIEFLPLDELYKEKIIFICVPIRNFKNTIVNIATSVSANTTIIDVCSVKMYPVDVMMKFLPKKINIIATHPLFGPDSFNKQPNLKIMMHNVRGINNNFVYWKNYFIQKKFQVIEMTPEEHDRQAALSQGVTHLIGRILQDANIQSTQIDTVGFQQLLTIINQTCQDSWDLFYDLQKYNPYSTSMIHRLQESCSRIITKSQ